jgi:VCBS repeat-containing protein
LLPATHVGALSLGVSGTATESSNGSAATKSSTLNLEVLAKGVTVTDLVDAGVNTAPDAKNDAPTTVLVEANATSSLTGQAITGGNGNVTDTDPNAGATLRVTGIVAGVGTIPTGTTAISSPVTVTGRYGSLQIAANGSYTYTLDNANPNTTALVNGQVAYDVFTYKIQDGQGGYDTATINITVNGVSPAVVNLLSAQSTTVAANSAPVAQDDSATTQTNTPLNIAAATLLANDTDANNDTLTITSVQGATNGTVALTNGSIVFTPTKDYSGAASFNYTVSDGHGGTSTATVGVTVNASNHAPVAFNDAASTAVDTPVTITSATLLGNDTDADGDPLSITSVQGATNGTVALVGGNVVFTPTAKYSGPASFSYTISDGHGGTSSASVSITVGTPAAANHAPVAASDSGFSTDANHAVTIAGATLLGNDTDADGDILAIMSVQGTTNGTVSLSGNDVIFTPTKDYAGVAGFSYTVSDGHGGTSTAGVSLVVNSVNHAPTAVSDSATTSANSPITIAVLSNDTDPDGNKLSITDLLGVSHGTASISGDSIVFVPAKDYVGDTSFSYTVSDGHGGTSTANVSVSVAPVNHAPTANSDAASTTANTPVSIAVLSNDTDPDGDPLSITEVLGVSNGSVAINGGSVVFTPTKDYVGDASFSYTVSDGHGGTASGSVSITIAADLLKAGSNPV